MFINIELIETHLLCLFKAVRVYCQLGRLSNYFVEHNYMQNLVSTYTYTHTYIHTYIHAYIHTYMHACMHACMHNINSGQRILTRSQICLLPACAMQGQFTVKRRTDNFKKSLNYGGTVLWKSFPIDLREGTSPRNS